MPRLTIQQREMNEERVDRIDELHEEYMSRVCDTDPDFVTDVLADLMHWAKANKVDFDNQLRIARDHFRVERTGNE